MVTVRGMYVDDRRGLAEITAVTALNVKVARRLSESKRS